MDDPQLSSERHDAALGETRVGETRVRLGFRFSRCRLEGGQFPPFRFRLTETGAFFGFRKMCTASCVCVKLKGEYRQTHCLPWINGQPSKQAHSRGNSVRGR